MSGDVKALVERVWVYTKPGHLPRVHTQSQMEEAIANGWVETVFIPATTITDLQARLEAERAENAKLREALAQARNDLLEVGNDYPGSSCQKWCTERAALAWNVLDPWRRCPSTHCERAHECRSLNECSANRATLGGDHD